MRYGYGSSPPPPPPPPLLAPLVGTQPGSQHLTPGKRAVFVCFGIPDLLRSANREGGREQTNNKNRIPVEFLCFCAKWSPHCQHILFFIKKGQLTRYIVFPSLPLAPHPHSAFVVTISPCPVLSHVHHQPFEPHLDLPNHFVSCTAP